MQRVAVLIVWALISLPVLAQTPITPEMTPIGLKVLSVKDGVVSRISACKEDFNDYAYVFDFFDYFWRAENHLEVTTAVLIWSKLSETEKDEVAVQSASEEVDFLAKYTAKDKDKKYEYCKSVMTAISQQDFKIAKLFPADSELLKKLFSERHSNKNFVRDNDITIGCVKRFYNDGAKNFPAAQQACECTTKTILAKGTSAEIDKWLAEEDKSVIFQEAWASGLVEALQACRPEE